MKVKYEIYLRTWASNNPNAKQDCDFETIDYEPCNNYSEALKNAKRLSKKAPFINSQGQEIADVQIAAFYEGEECEERYGTTYQLLWKEDFDNGVSIGRTYY